MQTKNSLITVGCSGSSTLSEEEKLDDFERDSYEYVKDKPIKLVNGENLLYMLKKHGYEARIYLTEAKFEIK